MGAKRERFEISGRDIKIPSSHPNQIGNEKRGINCVFIRPPYTEISTKGEGGEKIIISSLCMPDSLQSVGRLQK